VCVDLLFWRWIDRDHGFGLAAAVMLRRLFVVDLFVCVPLPLASHVWYGTATTSALFQFNKSVAYNHRNSLASCSYIQLAV
jgi:hypothetical protein